MSYRYSDFYKEWIPIPDEARPSPEPIFDQVPPAPPPVQGYGTHRPIFPFHIHVGKTPEGITTTEVHERLKDKPSDFRLKLVLLGDADSGKTVLLQRYTSNTFSPEYKQSLGASFAVKDLHIRNLKVKLIIWDIAGQPSFRQVRRHYFSGSHGAILVFDVANPSTFMTVLNWINDYRRICPKGLIVLVGNWKHQTKDRRVPFMAGKMVERRWGTPYFETDSATGAGIHEAFSLITSTAINNTLSNIEMRTGVAR